MEKDFLTNLGIEGETAEAILAESGRSEEKLFAELSAEARDLRISIAAKEAGVRDTDIFKLIIGDAQNIDEAVKKAKSSHGWLFCERETPFFSCKTSTAEHKSNPFAHGAGLN